MDESETKIFECNLNDTNLFTCILEEVGQEDINTILTKAPIIQERTFLNCLNASLVNCLKNDKELLDFPHVQLQTVKNESGDWLIKQINIIVDKQFDNNLIYERINQCLKFVRKACKLNDSIQLSVIQPEIKEDLKYFKVKLTEINQLFKQIRNDKSKKEKLFSIFRNMANQ